jgi:hypothetical protein
VREVMYRLQTEYADAFERLRQNDPERLGGGLA